MMSLIKIKELNLTVLPIVMFRTTKGGKKILTDTPSMSINLKIKIDILDGSILNKGDIFKINTILFMVIDDGVALNTSIDNSNVLHLDTEQEFLINVLSKPHSEGN